MAPKKKSAKSSASNGQEQTKREQADRLKEQGNKSLQNENYVKAIELFTQAIEVDDTCFAYFHNRSLALFLTEKYPAALEDALKCLELNPAYALGYLRKAAALLELDRSQEALATANQGLTVEADNKSLKEIVIKIEKEIAIDSVLPEENPEKIKHTSLTSWLDAGKSEFSSLKMRWYDTNYRGVHAAKKIYNRETILFVPKSHLITLEMARETVVAKKILAAKLNLLSPKHSFLSTFLLREKYDPLSPWRTYLDILPSNYSQFPVFFSEDDLQWLQGSPFKNQVIDKRADIQRDYDEICRVAPEFLEYGFEEFCWARMTASSRVFGLSIHESKTDAFVPLADMLNHRRPKQTSWQYDDDREGFVIQALEDIPRGEQVYDSYGRKCNSRFFLNYGFINADNDANEVAVRVCFDNDDPLLERKREMLGGSELPAFKQFRILDNLIETNVAEFLGYLRFVLVRDAAKLIWIQNMHESTLDPNDNLSLFKPQKTAPISIQNEIEVWTRVSLLVEQSLSLYPTTLQEDKQLLTTQGNVLMTNQKNCLLLRIGEKEILEFYKTMSESMIKLLRMSRKDINKVCLNAEYIKYSVYVNKVVITCLLNGQSI